MIVPLLIFYYIGITIFYFVLVNVLKLFMRYPAKIALGIYTALVLLPVLLMVVNLLFVGK